MTKKWLTAALVGLGLSVGLGWVSPSVAVAQDKGEVKAKFYDFSDQIIDGEIKKPTTLYTDVRKKAKFDRLLKLKKSFLPAILKTAKDASLK